MATTTKAALAAELSISKARVSQYVKAGLPVRSDGKLDRAEALNWIALNQRHALTGNKGARRAATIVKEQAPKLPRAAQRRPGDRFDPEVEVAKAALIQVGEHIARETVRAGGSIELAYTLYSTVVIALDGSLSKLLGRRGFEGFANGFDLLNLVGFGEGDPDWHALAASVGKVFDEQACDDHLNAVMFPPGWEPPPPPPRSVSRDAP